MNIAAPTKAENYNGFRRARDTLTPGAAYVHITRNNTIEGTQWQVAARCGRCATGRRHLVRDLQPPD